MHNVEQSLELNKMPEVVEDVNVLMCRRIYAHDCVFDCNCEFTVPSNGDALRDHQVHGNSHT